MKGMLRSISPIAHLAVTLCWIVPVFLSFDQVTPLLFLGLSLLYLVIAGQVPIGRTLRAFMPLMMLPFGLFVLNLFFTDATGHPLRVTVLSFSLNSYALHRALTLTFRSASLIVISVGYLLVTDPLELVNALMQQVGLPARVGFSIFVAWNTIPRLREDYLRIRMTHLIRYRGKKRPFRDLVPSAVTLLAGAIRHAQRAAISMGVRGIDEARERTFLHRSEWRARDTVYVAVNALVAGALIWLSVAEGWFVFGLG